MLFCFYSRKQRDVSERNEPNLSLNLTHEPGSISRLRTFPGKGVMIWCIILHFPNALGLRGECFVTHEIGNLSSVLRVFARNESINWLFSTLSIIWQ